MFILDSLLIGSLRFVLDKVVQAAEAEAQDDSMSPNDKITGVDIESFHSDEDRQT